LDLPGIARRLAREPEGGGIIAIWYAGGMPRSIPVVIDSHLRVDGNLIGVDLAEEIFDELTIVNTDKEFAKKTNRWGWQDLPDDFLLADLDGDTVVMPRGYAFQLKTLLRAKGLRVQWEDHRRWQHGPALNGSDGLSLKPHQQRAVRKIIRHQQGMYEAPTGAGKTVTCVGFMLAKLPYRTLILVDQLGLLNQWRKEIARWTGLNIDDIGQIGDGEWNVGARITVATVQTVWRAIENYRDAPELVDEFFAAWDCVIVDECHHVAARTIQEIVGRFNAKYRFGVSATPDRKNDKFEYALNVLGEVFHRDDEEELRAAGVLMRPTVHVVRTNFKHVYWGDHDSNEDDECLVPGCALSGKRPHWHRNNYQKVKSALVEDKARNNLVINTIRGQIADGPHHHLIVSDEVRHLTALHDALWDAGITSERVPGVYVMTGAVKGAKRAQMKAEIEQSASAIIFATVAKEGLDIPAIDRIYLPFPTGNGKKVQQWIGRGTRTFEGKTDIEVFDFFDINVGLLKHQFRGRRTGCYYPLNMQIDLG
jgi:superfamily II DNA or RNA helicase